MDSYSDEMMGRIFVSLYLHKYIDNFGFLSRVDSTYDRMSHRVFSVCVPVCVSG